MFRLRGKVRGDNGQYALIEGEIVSVKEVTTSGKNGISCRQGLELRIRDVERPEIEPYFLKVRGSSRGYSGYMTVKGRADSFLDLSGCEPFGFKEGTRVLGIVNHNNPRNLRAMAKWPVWLFTLKDEGRPTPEDKSSDVSSRHNEVTNFQSKRNDPPGWDD